MPTTKTILAAPRFAVHTQKTRIVSAAFDPPSNVDRSMIDKLARLNELLLYRSLSYRERRECGFWIPFGSVDYRDMFGSAGLEVMRAAKSIGMIDRNERYASGRFTKSIRLTTAYRDGEYREHELCKRPRSHPSRRTAKNLSHAGRWLADKLDSFGLSDHAVARNAWDALTAEFFRRGFHRPHRCEYGRFHSAATGLPKYLRRNLLRTANVQHMDTAQSGGPRSPSRSAQEESPRGATEEAGGALLVHLDVRNCQGLCMAALAQNSPWSGQSDTQKWKELAETGRLYEEIVGFLRSGEIPPHDYIDRHGTKRTCDPCTWDRAKVKKNFMVAIFADRAAANANPVGQAIAKLFRSVWQFVDETKRVHGYRAVAHRLQRLESTIVIDGVCGYLASHHPDVPVLTVHDCVIAPACHEQMIRDLLRQEFARYGVGVRVDSDE